MDLHEMWEQTLLLLAKRVSKPSFETWLKDTVALSFQDDILYIGTPSGFARSWLNNRYHSVISEALEAVLGDYIEFQIVDLSLEAKAAPQEEGVEQMAVATESEVAATTEFSEADLSSDEEDPLKTPLNPRYSFDTFVIGSGNRFAHAAALAVAEAPAKAYNPLFIYGGVGLGKTHLMHAIGHYIREQNPASRVVYLSSEKFTNEFINAIRDNRAEGFRNKYRSVDVLLIDDIQFLAKKEQTQEEFFHTFNTLHEGSKQIVISSDRPPREIPTLEDRLRSRFEWGLITDIQPPDLETRIAILRKKAKADNLDVPEEVLAFIADQVDNNIRELEGALIRVVAYSALMNHSIDRELAADALKEISSDGQPKVLSVYDVQKIVSTYYRLQVDDLKSKKRTKNIAFPRQIAMYLARALTDQSLPKIGSEFGGRDHTTVMHAHDKIKKALVDDAQVQHVIKELTKRLTGE